MPWPTIIVAIASLTTLSILLRLCWRLVATSPSPAAVNALGQRADRRSLSRMKVSCRVTLTGIHGGPFDLPARCADLSEYGALILVRQPLEPGTEVVLRFPSLRLIGVGRVRHCRRRIFRYAAGIEFNGPLRRADAGNWTILKQTSGAAQSSKLCTPPPKPLR